MVFCAASIINTVEPILTDEDINAGFEHAKRRGYESVFALHGDPQGRREQLKDFFDFHCAKCKEAPVFAECLRSEMLVSLVEREDQLKRARDTSGLNNFYDFLHALTAITSAFQDDSLKRNTRFSQLLRQRKQSTQNKQSWLPWLTVRLRSIFIPSKH